MRLQREMVGGGVGPRALPAAGVGWSPSGLVVGKSMPGVADFVAACSPPWRKVSNGLKCWIDVQRFAHGDHPSILGHVGGPARKCPRMIVGVMGDAKNRKLAFKDLSRRNRSHIGCLIEWPIISRGAHRVFKSRRHQLRPRHPLQSQPATRGQ